jgi:membrane-associated protease RseP (regulator of RpoE activity)
MTTLTSLAVVALGALTLGAGTVVGGGGSSPSGTVLAALSSPGGDAGGGNVRVLALGGGTWLGVEIDEISDARADELHMDRARGALVKSVKDESPAARAGIRDGDVIVSFQGEAVMGVLSLHRMVRETPGGRKVEIGLLRDGKQVSVEAQIEERSHRTHAFRWNGDDGEGFKVEIPDIDIRIPQIFRYRSGRPMLGVSVEGLNPQLAAFLGVQGEQGVFIKQVYEETPAERAGIRAGDVIVEIEGRRIGDVGDLMEELSRNAGRTASMLIVRDKSERTIEVTLEEADQEWEESRILGDDQRREIERALEDAREAQRDAMRQYRSQVRELGRGARELRQLERLQPRRSGATSPVEI